MPSQPKLPVKTKRRRVPPWGNGGTRRAVSASRPDFCYCSKFGLAVLMS